VRGFFIFREMSPMIKKLRTMHVRLDVREVAQLDHTCKRLGLSRSDVVRRSLQVALPCFDGIVMPGDAPDAREEQNEGRA
jgi:Ribbon-helix-helix protein, copG family